jgi:hypothetical protein
VTNYPLDTNNIMRVGLTYDLGGGRGNRPAAATGASTTRRISG